jgi:Trypsin-like peptidase domain
MVFAAPSSDYASVRHLFRKACSRVPPWLLTEGPTQLSPHHWGQTRPSRDRPHAVSLALVLRRLLFCSGIFVALSPGVAASCIDPSSLTKTTVSISREFAEDDKKPAPDVVAIGGTGWFLSPRLLVTAAHVAEAMQLSSTHWKDIEIRNSGSKTIVATRIHGLAGPLIEKMALLHLHAPFSGAVARSVRREPLTPEERVVALAYPHSRLRFAAGRFVEFGASNQFAGAAMMEIYEGDDRLVLDHGASGAPVLDCQGRVVAVVSSILTRTLSFGFAAVRISTSWQTPNVVSIPAEARH